MGLNFKQTNTSNEQKNAVKDSTSKCHNMLVHRD